MATEKLEGVDLSYVTRGSGPSVVLLHGFPVDGRMWNAQLEELSRQHRIIVPDLRGFGGSTSADPFTIDSLADDVHALLKRLRALPCVLGGFSMGGYVALAYVQKYPTDLRGLILIDTKAEADSAQQKEGRQKMIELVRESGAAAVAGQMMPKMLTGKTIESGSPVASSLRAMMETCPPLTLEHALLAMRDRPDRSTILPSIPVPTLILVGDADSITPVDIAESMRRQIPNAELSIISGANHMSPMEQPAQVTQAIRSFLERL